MHTVPDGFLKLVTALKLLLKSNMSSDDEIAVVYNKKDGMWYVKWICAQRYEDALEDGKKFPSKGEALLFASSIDKHWHAEYGIRVYDSKQ